MMMETIYTDICIIGSGMGGGTLALSLAKEGKNPLVVEAGTEANTSSPDRVTHVESGRPFGLPVTRAIEVGGSTNLWHGVVSPLDPFDFCRTNSDEYQTWPLPYAHMQAYWTRAIEFLGMSDPQCQRIEQLPTTLLTRRNDIEHNNTLFDEKLFRVMAKPRRLKVDLLAAERAGQLSLLKGAVAHEFVVSEHDSRLIDHVLVTQGSNRIRIRSKRFILAAGALESPRLLLNSSPFNANRSPQVSELIGCCLMDHPMGFLGKLQFKNSLRAPLFSDIPEQGRNRYRIGLVPREPEVFGNSNLYLRPSPVGESNSIEDEILLSLTALRGLSGLRFNHVITLASHPRVAYRAVANRFALPIKYRSADLFFVMEQTPFRESRVKLAGKLDAFGYPVADVEWQVSRADKDNMSAYITQVANKGLNSDSYHFIEKPKAEKWEESFTSAAHHLGSLRMARTALHGAVDPNLKVFGTSNLWVCDGSVFPTGGNANPSLTICALALRLKDFLLNNSNHD